MKNALKLLSVFLAVAFIVCSFTACEGGTADVSSNGGDVSVQEVDYVSQLKLDMNSSTVKQEVTVKTYVDGDTTHFHVPKTVSETGVLKARYLAIDTPESTGKIEEYGKKASNFTKEKLKSATSIIVESDGEKLELDSTGGRYLVWVWYKTADDAEYRNLNLEILQNGLAVASSSANNRYGEICSSALAQAKALKLNVFSGEKDPDMYYGDAIELTLEELRSNIEAYSNKKVAFEGVITLNNNNTIYVENEYADANMYCGMSVYLGYGLPGEALEILSVGNRVRIVGTVQYYEAGGTYQVSGLSYRSLKPDDPNNVQLISKDNQPAYLPVTPEMFTTGKVKVEVEGEEKEVPFADMALSTSVSMENLDVVDIYTTQNEESSSFGAMTLTCKSGENTVYVRTNVFRKENGELMTEADYKDKNISIKGIVDYYDGSYQIRVLEPKFVTVNN